VNDSAPSLINSESDSSLPPDEEDESVSKK